MYQNNYMYPRGFPTAVCSMAASIRILIPFPGDERGEDGVDGNSQGWEGLATTIKGWFGDGHMKDGWPVWAALAVLMVI